MKKIAVLLDGQIRNDGRVRRTIESLSSKFKVDLFCVYSEFDDNSLFNENVQVFHYNLDNSWINKNLLMHLRFNELKIAFEKNKSIYDFIYVNDYPLLPISTKLAKDSNAKLIYDSHEIYIETINQFFPLKTWKALYGYPLVWMNKIIHSRIEKMNVKQVDQVITVCESLKYYFEKKWSINNVIVVKNCPKDIAINKNPVLLQNQLQLKSTEKIILYQGDVNISRGIVKMVEAMQFINKDIHFVVIGGGPRLEEFKDKYSSNRIHFLGKIPFDMLYEYISSADVGLSIIEPYNLSKKYALPNKIFEYMVASKPFITNNLPESSKIANECNCGFVIDDSTPQKIASAINEITNRIDLEEIGKRGREVIEEKYNWDVEIKKIIDYLIENHYSAKF
ncbi:MAG: glycosyltransferase [Crocinitomicaceae bacterium]|nr:glycosyltransferase [Crocinitomicaceae bacterium]